MTLPFEITDWSTAGQGNTFVTDLAIPFCAAFGAVGFWHKSSEGSTYDDPAFARRRPFARAYRYSGPFHWLTPTSRIAAQLGNFTDHVGDLAVGEGIQLDCEQAGLSLTWIIMAWEAWAAVYGQDRVGVYTGAFFTGGTQKTPIVNDLPPEIPWWLAWYGPSAFSQIQGRLPRQPFLWQWGGGNEGLKIPALGNRRVDSNQIIDRARLERFCGYTPEPVPVPDPPHTGPTPAPLPPPTTAWALVPEEDDMPVRIGPLLIQATGKDGSPVGAVYLTDGRGIELRRLRGTGAADQGLTMRTLYGVDDDTAVDELADARYQLHMAGYPADAIDGPPTPVDRVSAFGHVVNP